MRHRLLVFTVLGLLLVLGGCGFDRGSRQTVAGAGPDSAAASAASGLDSADTALTEALPKRTTTTRRRPRTTTTTTTTTTTSSFGSDSGFGSDSSTTGGTTSSGGDLPGYSETFKSSFVTGCSGKDPAKETACRCTIDAIARTIPYSDFLKNFTSPEVLRIARNCGLNSTSTTSS